MPPRNQLIACVIRQYDAGLYRAWVSLDKGHMVCLGASQDEADAAETIDRFLDTYQDGRIETPEDILPLIDLSRARGPDSAFARDRAVALAGWRREGRSVIGIQGLPPYNAARHASGLIIAALADDVALNCHMWRNDARSHYQHFIGALINAYSQER